MTKVLVSGGAGYIGSHVVKLLGKEGYDIVVVDNLSSGHRDAVLCGNFIEADIGDKIRMDNIIKEHQPHAVLHFAAFIEVGESVIDPIKYYQNNTANTLNFLDVLVANNVDKFIFSSTAAVYGLPENVPIVEDEPLRPINPYGFSKRFNEQILEDISNSTDFKYVSLRYFNACGADPDGDLGERHNPESHLIPLVLQTASGKRENIKIFGTDYDTPDGTCVRDYIHINDLANAHIMALEYLLEGGKSDVFNLGYGNGFSVKEIIDYSKEVTGIDFTVIKADRREGDPPSLIADSSKIVKKLGWKPEYNDIEFIVKTAWNWEQKLRS